MGTIYVLENKINKKCYIGQTIRKLNRRMNVHKSDSRNIKKTVISRAINKYGMDNFIIHKYYVPINMLDYFEIEMIKQLNTLAPNGYNLNSGGNVNKIFTKEAINNMSKAHIGKSNGKHSKETRKKISESNMGKVVTEEAKLKMSISHKGFKHSEETKLKMKKNNSKYWLGKKRTVETINKISENNKGKVAWNKDKTGIYSKETLIKIGNASRGRKQTVEDRKNKSIALTEYWRKKNAIIV